MRPLLLAGHTRPLTRVKYNREGDLLFTSGRDNSANLWYSHNGERVGTFDGHNGSILDIDIDHLSRRLLTGSADMTARLWDVQTGQCIHDWEMKTPVRSVAFAMGDKKCLIVTDNRMGHPATLYIFDLENISDTPILEQPLTGSSPTVAEWGDLNEVIYTGHENGMLCMFDPYTGDKIDEKRIHKGRITDLQLSLDKTCMITSSKDFTAKILDARTLRELKIFVTTRSVNSAAMSPLFEQIALGGGQEASQVTTVGKDGKFEVRFFHRIFQEEMGRVKGHFGPINTIAFHPDGKSFTSGGEDGYVRVHHFDEQYFAFKDEI